MESQYILLMKTYNEMREEYKILPSKFLLKKIELVHHKIKAIDKTLGSRSVGGGNYPSVKAFYQELDRVDKLKL